jgi:hypothetical protein
LFSDAYGFLHNLTGPPNSGTRRRLPRGATGFIIQPLVPKDVGVSAVFTRASEPPLQKSAIPTAHDKFYITLIVDTALF